MEDDVRDEQVEIEFLDDEGGPPAATVDAGEVGAGEAESGEAERLRQELESLREQYLRKLADFENYRKRQDREMETFRRHAAADLVRDLLSVLDNLERAAEVPADGSDAVQQGVQLVLKQFKDLLARHGVVEIDPAGEPFDPALHEAIQREDSTTVEQNTVVQVLQKGYLLHEKLLRPALVVVAVPVAGGDPPRVG